MAAELEDNPTAFAAGAIGMSDNVNPVCDLTFGLFKFTTGQTLLYVFLI